jgi:anti-anti-sigma regulatory factor
MRDNPGATAAPGAGSAPDCARRNAHLLTGPDMKTLQVDQAFTVVKLTDALPAKATLTEQLEPYVDRSPNLILDVSGIQFNSMLIGEIVNVHRTFEERWKNDEHRIAVVNLTDVSRTVFRRIRLDEFFPIFDTLSDALYPAPEVVS